MTDTKGKVVAVNGNLVSVEFDGKVSLNEVGFVKVSRAFDDYYIKDCGVISTPEVSRGGPTTMTTRHRRGTFCAGLPLILFANTYTLTFLFKQEHMVVLV